MVNVITILIVAWMLLSRSRSLTQPQIALALTVIGFEVWHAVCHARPSLLTPEDRMLDVTRGLYLTAMVALAAVVYSYGGCMGSPILFWGGFAGLLILDLLVWTTIRRLWMIYSGLLIAVYLLLGLVMSDPRKFYSRRVLFIMMMFFIAGIVLYNEKRWCKSIGHHFPLHVVTEIVLCLIIISTLDYLLRPWGNHNKPMKRSIRMK